jgi:Zn-dependent protease
MQMFTKEEIRDLIIAVVAITIIFSFTALPNPGIDSKFLYYGIIVIIAFGCHELAHKFVARKFGCAAFFKLWPQGIFFGLLLMLFGIKFVAPGAVMIYPFTFGRWGYRVIRLTVSENGLISLAGPATNLFFAIIFSFFGGWFFNLLVFINAWLALINLLPIPPLDGSKILQWKIWLWVFMIAISFILIFPYFFR